MPKPYRTRVCAAVVVTLFCWSLAMADADYLPEPAGLSTGVARPQPDMHYAASRTDWQSGGESEACRKRRERLERTRAKLRHGYKPSQGESLRRRRDEDRAWLRRNCAG